ncbi:mspIM [Symbiodinium sp. KB8]|nr:mspIM [Symbiodinium sp. KB8]
MALSKPPSSIANGQYTVQKLLGAGCFGQVWSGTSKDKDLSVAIKFEDNQGKNSPLGRGVTNRAMDSTTKRAFQEVEWDAMSYWQDIRSLYEASTSLQLPFSRGGAFHVALDGRANWHEGRWLIPGFLLSSWYEGSQPVLPAEKTSVLVAVSEVIYQAIAKHSPVLRILQAQVSADSATPVIDTCRGLSVVAGPSVLQNSEVVEIAEVFCGGFNGWSQGVHVLRSFGYQGRVKWLLDTAQECFLGTRQVNPGATCIYEQATLLEEWTKDSPTFICASLEHVWWLQGPALTQPSILCASPPCQPWSSGGMGTGLESPDGLLFLHLIGQIAFLQPPVVLIEQVPGFRQHKHFDTVQHAWTDAGYTVAWMGMSDLLECAPVTRKRFLVVLQRADLEAPAVAADTPVLPPRPTLGSFDCLLDLPLDMLKACQLSEETLQLYLDPWFLPTRLHAAGRPQNPKSFRLRGPSDRAACFVAQYHFQHELPQGALERAGLFGVLLSLPEGARFFSGAEIALIHGAVCPIWLPRDDRSQMRLIGNALSPIQAVTPLALALQLVGPRSLRVSSAQATLQCLSMRLRASQVDLLSLREGWVLHRQGEAFAAVVEALCWEPRQTLPPSGYQFGSFELYDDADTCQIVLAPDVSITALLALLGHEFPEECLEQLHLCPVPLDVPFGPAAELPGESCLQLDRLPTLPFRPLQANQEQNLLVVAGRQAYYFLLRDGPLFYWAMAQVMAMEGWKQAAFFEEDTWTTFEGHTIRCKDDLQGVVQFRVADPFVPPARVSLHQLDAFASLSVAAPPRLRVAGPDTVTLCKGFPAHLFQSLGWGLHMLPQATNAQLQADITFVPCRDRFRIPEAQVMPVCAKHLLASLFRSMETIAMANHDPTTACKVQVQGCTFWQGLLPSGLEFSELGDLWEAAGIAVKMPTPVRVYSGPKQVPPAMLLAHASQGPCAPGFVNKAGWLLVSFMPETRGGGAKDVKYKTAQTDMAQLLLDQGLSLSQTTAIVDKIMPLAGLPRIQRVFELTEADNRWMQFQALCKQFSVALPEVASGATKALMSTATEAARRRTRAEPQPKAADFALLPGFFRNSDDSPAAVLNQLMPGATGVYLCDATDAARLLQDWKGNSSDELGLVVLGHSCPHASTCQGHRGIPAVTSSGHQVLLHACWHNLGKASLHTKCDVDATVTLPEAACVCATVFKDEIAPADWQGFTQNPVRMIADKLRSAGSSVTLEAPWGRSFRKDGKACAPADCESVQFHCRVQANEVLQLLRCSGHSQVYLTPKTWQGEVAKGYAVVWAPGDKDEVARLSLQVPDPLGLVRAKRRFGVRVAEAAFEAAWAIVRPNQDAPAKVEVNGLYKLLSAPPQVRGTDIQDWAKQMGWDVRPLRCMGPGQWLLGASGPPPAGLLSINQQVVLVQAVAPRQSSKSVVCAGRIPRPVSSVQSPPKEDDPLVANDPWRNYLAAAGRTVAAPPGPRQIEAPHQQRYDQQECRLQKLEAGLEEVRRGHTAMAQQLATTQSVVEQQVDQVKDDMNLFAKDFRQQLQNNAEQLRTAQMAHQVQMQAGIDDIKAMLLSTGRSSAAKRPADQEADLPEMSDL